jgi:8-oxo-dGTP diphosphatase
MELLKTIKDEDLGIKEVDIEDVEAIERETSRAIVLDENGHMPIMFVSKFNYHKLPGGGIDEGETREKALVREMLEETGSEIEVFGEVGEVVEFRGKWNMKQSSYCYYGKVLSKGEPSFTEKELRYGFMIKWVPIDEAISLVENDDSDCYEGKFIKERDLTLLKKAKEFFLIDESLK